MPEENQNYQNTSSLRAETDMFQNVKQMIKDRVNKDMTLRKSQEWQALYEKSLTSSNQDLCGQYDRACKVYELARWARKYGESKWYDWSNVEDLDLVQQYSDAFPDSAKIMYDYITRADEDDPMPYYIKLWWEQPTEEDEANTWFKNFQWSFDKLGQWLRTIWNDSNTYSGKGQIWAIQDYAYNTYWPNPTEEEWKAVERDLRIDPSLLNRYLDPNTWIKDVIMWWVVTAMNATPLWLWINVATSWLASTDTGEKVFWILWQWAETVWYYANKFPWLKQYRDVLATEEDKREWDQFVWQNILALITGWAIKSYKEIKNISKDWGWAWWLYQKFQQSRQEKLNNKLQDTGGKIAWAKTVKEQEIATRGLQDADIKWSRNYAELTERLKKRGQEIEAQEDIEYAKNEKKWKPEETRIMKDFEKDWYKSSVLLKPIEDWIELLKNLYEWSPEKLAQLDLIEQKFKAEWLTKWEMNNIARAIVDEYDTYKKRWEPKPSMAAKDVEWIRKAVKEFAREGNDKLVELDKKWSDNLNTRQMISDIQDSIVNFTTKQRHKNLFQKLTWAAADIVVWLWWREVLQKLWLVSKEISWPNEYTPVLRQSDLKKLTNKFSKLNEKLNWAKTKSEAEKIVEDFNNEMNEEFWPIEGEVIEKAKSEWYKDGNSYLEDKIEVKEETNP